MALLFLLSLLFIQTLISSAADGQVLRVKYGEDVVLPCSINKDITSNTFEWTKVNSKEVYLYQNNGEPFGNQRDGQDKQFKDRTSHFQEELSKGNASIKITETKLADSGNYMCSFINPSGPTFSVQLVVGACPKPYVKSHYPEQDRAELQCEVFGVSDKLEIEWRDSSDHGLDARNTTHRRQDGSYDIELNATVTKSGTYHCVITQKDICHQVFSSTDVNIKEQHHNTTSAETVALRVVVIVLVLALLAGAGGFCYQRWKRKKQPEKKGKYWFWGTRGNGSEHRSAHGEETDK